jgi:hypothetical protein
MAAEMVNPPKSKLFGTVACPKTYIMEFNHPLDHCSQARCHLWFSLVIIDMWQQQILVQSLGGNVHINQEPLPGGAFLAALEKGI